MTYEIKINRSSQKSLAKLPQKYQNNIISAIRSLSGNVHPNGCKKLSGRNAWRIRIGRYRVIYEIHDNELFIMVISIAHRKDVYK